MPIKTVLTYADGTARDDGRLAATLAVSRHYHAHVSVVAIGIEPEIPTGAYAGFGETAFRNDFHGHTVAGADALARTMRSRLEAEAVRSDVSTLVTTPGALSNRFGHRARYSDLVVLAAPEDGRFDRTDADAFEGALFTGDGLVMVGPDSMKPDAKTVMIGWDGNVSALHAVRRARPMLEAADTVEIAMVDPSSEQAQSGEDLAVMLSRHGLVVSVARIAGDGRPAAEALGQRQIEIGADLTVMGGYGHSRFREFVLGGVTRDFPGMSNTPLLIAH
ncbi:universal stress protein [Chachezhania antarctica]|uniref:universal stress protein n=1 Tax=Chachezhania antarctica TaxID=2340860 RepID=UPI000EB51040|nr:universal stress protein [Chachezhania antarctica]|tara:strand:- start:2006 stop:2833 length:828 start_codon:yes stop_codon:yes gene_type:complete